jgi:DNA-binding NarL/FixJ family response regulator
LFFVARPGSSALDRASHLVQPNLLARNPERFVSCRQDLEEARTASSWGVIALDALWNQLTSRQLVILDESFPDDQESRVTLRRGPPRAATRAEARDFVVLRRTLTGEPRKCIAIDLGIAQSTVSTSCAGALRALGLNPSATCAPLALLLAAYAASQAGASLPGPTAFWTDAGPFWIARVTCPDESVGRLLSSSERTVMRLLLRGKTRAQIASERRTSQRTVSNQLHAVFRKLRVSGRAELVGRLISAGRDLGGEAVRLSQEAAGV